MDEYTFPIYHVTDLNYGNLKFPEGLEGMSS